MLDALAIAIQCEAYEASQRPARCPCNAQHGLHLGELGREWMLLERQRERLRLDRGLSSRLQDPTAPRVLGLFTPLGRTAGLIALRQLVTSLVAPRLLLTARLLVLLMRRIRTLAPQLQRWL